MVKYVRFNVSNKRDFENLIEASEGITLPLSIHELHWNFKKCKGYGTFIVDFENDWRSFMLLGKKLTEMNSWFDFVEIVSR